MDKERWHGLCHRPKATYTQSTCHHELPGTAGIAMVMRIHVWKAALALGTAACTAVVLY